MTRPYKPWMFRAVPLICLLITACDLVSLRTPEPPSGGSGVYVQADTPEQVTENMRAAVSALSLDAYRRSLAPSMRFQPAAGVVSSDPLWQQWGTNEEERYFASLIGAVSGQTGHLLTLTNGQYTSITEQQTLFEASYDLVVQHARSDRPRRVKGKLTWLIEQDSGGLWEITDWSDFVGDDDSWPTWTDLKWSFAR